MPCEVLGSPVECEAGGLHQTIGEYDRVEFALTTRE